MPLESASFVNQLDQTRPTATDVKSEGDDVMRLIKSTLKNSFPNVGGAMNATHTELNRLVGASEDVQPRLSATLSAPNGETLNRLPAAASRQGGFLTFNASTGQPEVGFSLGAASGNSLGIFSVSNVTTFFTAGSERMRIDAIGNVAIGGVLTSGWRATVQGPDVTAPNNSSVFRLYQNSDGGTSMLFQNAVGVLARVSGAVTSTGTGTDDGVLTFETSINGGLTERMRIDSPGNVITNVNTVAPTLTTNQQMVFALTSNTNLRISVRGTDGTTRVANITLA